MGIDICIDIGKEYFIKINVIFKVKEWLISNLISYFYLFSILNYFSTDFISR